MLVLLMWRINCTKEAVDIWSPVRVPIHHSRVIGHGLFCSQRILYLKHLYIYDSELPENGTSVISSVLVL
ncbi:hypothetical protein F0562_026731 [Nyssa sinensis]|uniref:Uncharacterized protein n=1 Tax=Nyssa sinensis TaxID=561372 RepID=A0A5J5BBI0_9ASTE|nr:hypothetical protein F0562_026731 [Nyssa sinensis]